MASRKIKIIMYKRIRVYYYKWDSDRWRYTSTRTYDFGAKLPRTLHKMMDGSIPLSDTMTIDVRPTTNSGGTKLIIEHII